MFTIPNIYEPRPALENAMYVESIHFMNANSVSHGMWVSLLATAIHTHHLLLLLKADDYCSIP